MPFALQENKTWKQLRETVRDSKHYKILVG